MISASSDAGLSLARTASIEATSGRRTGEMDDTELMLFSRLSFARLSLVHYPPHAHETKVETQSPRERAHHPADARRRPSSASITSATRRPILECRRHEITPI